jgi:hypothetical protein
MTKKIKWSEEGYKKILEASAKGRQTRLEKSKAEYGLNLKLCINCNEVIPYSKKNNIFCNRSCSASYNNTIFPKRDAAEKKFCLNCNCLLTSNKEYCNHSCFHEKRYRDFIGQWLEGKIEGGNQYTASSFVKKYLREQCSGACQICHQDTWLDQPMPLVCDHINGNSNDHSPQNLRMICGNCDMLLPTYKSKNKNSGRAYRRERYIQGKSY